MAHAFRWVDDDAGLATLVDELRGEPEYALDTEFHRERSYWPSLALVQVAWSGGIALVDPYAVDVRPLAEVLEGPGVAVLHAADQDLEVLDRACGAVPTTLFDTQVAAGFVGFSSPSLSTLVDRLRDERLPKADRISDWTVRPLTAEQMDYAAADVAHLLALRRQIEAMLVERGRLGWAHDECELLRTRSRAPQDPETAWWRVKESRTLRGRSRGVAQAVAAWREREAARLDRPTRHVLADLAILAIAHRPPTTIEELQKIRGVDGRLRGDAGKAVLAAVRRGLDLPQRELRVPPVDDLDRRLRPAVTLTSAWIAQLAGDLDIETALVATRADLHALLSGDPEARLSHGWRAEVVGEPVRRLVEGRAALAFDGRGGLVLEDRPGQPAGAGRSTTATSGPTEPS